MNILYLAHRIPYPPNKGDKIRSFNQLKSLSETHQVDLVCLADEPGDMKYKENLLDYCRKVEVFPLSPASAKIKGAINLLLGGTISTAYFYKKVAQDAVDSLLSQNKYDAIVCFSSVMAEYVFRSQFGTGAATLIMDFCDVDSDKWRQYAADASFPMNIVYGIEFKRLLNYEQKVNQNFDKSVFVTEQEANLFRQLYPKADNLYVVKNGVDHHFFSPQADFPRLKKSSPTIVFTGAMDYHANVDAVVWFCHDIWPKVKSQLPDCQFYIAGSKPTQAVRNLEFYKDVTVTGFVDDIRSYYDFADVCVIPLRLARGVQNKVLEAMAMNKPVVTTSKIALAIGSDTNGVLFCADDANDFIRLIVDVVKSANASGSKVTESRQYILDNYDWDKNNFILSSLISEVL